MTDLITELNNILKEEIGLFKELCKLEEEKTEAILEKNGRTLESISCKQEELLKPIDLLESNRRDLIDKYKDISWPGMASRDISLKDVAALNGRSANGIAEQGMELKKILMKMKSLQEINQKMLNDNLEFFNITINELKNAVSIKSGYGEKGIEKKSITNPLLFNQRA